MPEPLYSYKVIVVYHQGLPTKTQEYTVYPQTDEGILRQCRNIIKNNEAVHSLLVFKGDETNPILDYHRGFGELQDGY